jgi:hypothetical protein
VGVSWLSDTINRLMNNGETSQIWVRLERKGLYGGTQDSLTGANNSAHSHEPGGSVVERSMQVSGPFWTLSLVLVRCGAIIRA